MIRYRGGGGGGGGDVYSAGQAGGQSIAGTSTGTGTLRLSSGSSDPVMVDGDIQADTVGTHSVTLGNLITMDSQTPSAAGQIGMNAITGRLLLYIGGASRYALADSDLAPDGGTTAGTVVQASDSRLSGSGGSLGTAAAVTTYGGAFDGDVTFDTGGATPHGLD